VGDWDLITNQENKAFDLKNNGREEERRRQREQWRREFPPRAICSCRDANVGLNDILGFWLCRYWSRWGSVLLKKFLEKWRLRSG